LNGDLLTIKCVTCVTVAQSHKRGLARRLGGTGLNSPGTTSQWSLRLGRTELKHRDAKHNLKH